ncbi:MAG: hypothetical protein JWM21_2072 [Acidobacteria bacterium]|nr:hypothetical protein [Acidobacteriota bacterium]
MNHENIRFTTICPELHAQTIVAEAVGCHRAERQLEAPANFLRQIRVGTTAEDDNCSHELLPVRQPVSLRIRDIQRRSQANSLRYLGRGALLRALVNIRSSFAVNHHPITIFFQRFRAEVKKKTEYRLVARVLYVVLTR